MPGKIYIVLVLNKKNSIHLRAYPSKDIVCNYILGYALQSMQDVGETETLAKLKVYLHGFSEIYSQDVTETSTTLRRWVLES